MEFYKSKSYARLKCFIKDVGWVYEEWKDVKGYELLYAVSSFGRFWSYDRLVYQPYWGRCALRKGRFHSLRKKKSTQYIAVVLSNDAIRWDTTVHNLVAITFLKRGKQHTQINHIDGVKHNNIFLNLEWCTPLENVHHSVKIGLQDTVGSMNGRALLTEEQVIEMRKNYVRKKQGYAIELAKKYGISPRQAQKVSRGEAWKHIIV